jgi:hypothetical protein
VPGGRPKRGARWRAGQRCRAAAPLLTKVSYRDAFRPVRERLGNRKLQSITKADIENLVHRMLTSGRKRGGKPGTGLGARSVRPRWEPRWEPPERTASCLPGLAWTTNGSATEVTDRSEQARTPVRESTDLKVCGCAAADVLREARPLRPEAKFIRRHAGLYLRADLSRVSIEVRGGPCRTRRSSLN